MGVEVNRKPRESASAMLRRFSRKIQLSGVLLSAKKSRFKNKEDSKNMRRISALRREKIKKERKRLDRLGLLK
jgi:ribosomal protein S21